MEIVSHMTSSFRKVDQMNRFDRIISIIVHLQSKKYTTAQEMASQFSVSVRTIYRDIRTLEESGIPIGSEPGKGYFLVEGYSLRPTSFSNKEAHSLLIAEKIMSAFADSYTQKSFSEAFLKIRAILNSEEKNYISIIENTVSAHSTNSIESTNKYYIQEVQYAIFEKKTINIQYLSNSKQSAIPREIEPIAISLYNNNWYLLAFCLMRKNYRIFRMDRIQKVYPGSHLISHNHPSVESILQRIYLSKPLCKVVFRAQKGNGLNLLKSNCRLGVWNEKDCGDKIEITLMADSLETLAEWLIRYCKKIEILAPEELRTIMKKRLAEIMSDNVF